MAEWPRGRGTPERQAGNRAHVIFELAGVRAFDGPVAGIVHARRHFVGDEPAARDEEFDGEHAHVVEMFEQAARGALRLARERGIDERRTRQAQDAFAVHVQVEWIEGDGAIECRAPR